MSVVRGINFLKVSLWPPNSNSLKLQNSEKLKAHKFSWVGVHVQEYIRGKKKFKK